MALVLVAIASCLSVASAVAQEPARLPEGPAVTQEPAPGGAPAQRRAAARALGDVALSVQAELRMLGADLVAATEPADSKSEDCFNRAIADLVEGRFGEKVQGTFGYILLLGVLPPQARVVAPRLQRASAQMKAVATGDRILAEGVDAWVEASDFDGRLASVRATTCSVLRAWHRNGFRPSKAPRELLAFARLLDTAPETFDRLQRAERRMLQLGAKSRGAVAFGETLSEFGPTEFGGTSTSSGSGTSFEVGPVQPLQVT